MEVNKSTYGQRQNADNTSRAQKLHKETQITNVYQLVSVLGVNMVNRQCRVPGELLNVHFSLKGAIIFFFFGRGTPNILEGRKFLERKIGGHF